MKEHAGRSRRRRKELRSAQVQGARGARCRPCRRRASSTTSSTSRRSPGVDHVCLGSDFDGIPLGPAGLDDVSKLPFITASSCGADSAPETSARSSARTCSASSRRTRTSPPATRPWTLPPNVELRFVAREGVKASLRGAKRPRRAPFAADESGSTRRPTAATVQSSRASGASRARGLFLGTASSPCGTRCRATPTDGRRLRRHCREKAPTHEYSFEPSPVGRSRLVGARRRRRERDRRVREQLERRYRKGRRAAR